MSSKQAKTTNPGKVVLVTGGCGFLGRYIVEKLLEKGFQPRIFDRIKTFEDEKVQFFIGDLQKPSDVEEACKGAVGVIHTASLTETSGIKDAFYAINVGGTKHIIQACQKLNIEALVYTSSPSVVFNGQDIVNGNESLPIPDYHLDYYCETKAIAEKLVTKANGSLLTNGKPLYTCSLRPHAMFGPRDNHMMPGILKNAKTSFSRVYIGGGENIVDFTYVGNAADAHVLALEKLLEKSPQVAGQAYFITNDEPRKFWGFLGEIQTRMGYNAPSISLPTPVAFGYGYVSEAIYNVLSLCSTRRTNFKPKITRYIAANVTTHHYFSVDKARRELGYNPTVDLETALKMTLASYAHEANTQRQ